MTTVTRSALTRRGNVSRLADAKRRGDPEFPDFQLADSPLYLVVRTAGRYAQELENALNASGMDVLSWVKLSKRPSDARVTEVQLTPFGKRCVERQRSTAGEIYRRAVQDFSAAEIAVLNGLTRRIFANLSA
jgi:hypothetical protein